MSKRPPITKRKLWVDRSIQLPLLVYMIAMASVGTAAAAVYSLYYVVLFPPGSSPVAIGMALLMGAIFCHGLMLGLGLYVTNRVAGPLVRLKEHIESLNRGEKVEPLVVRKHDYVNKDLIEAYNRLVEDKMQ
jgi:hypothetical protein